MVGDSGIDPKLVVQLSTTHINTSRMHGTPLEEAIGETTGGCPHIQDNLARWVVSILIQKAREFFPGPANKTRRLLHSEVNVVPNVLSRLVEDRRPAAHLAREDQAPPLAATFAETAGHQKVVETNFFTNRSHISRGRIGAAGIIAKENLLLSRIGFIYSEGSLMKKEEQEIDLDRLCVLARLSLSPEEKEKLGPQLARIIGYVEQLKEVDVEGVEPMAHAIPLENVFRKDEATPLVEREDYLRNAPASRAGQVVVPKVIEG